MNAALAMPPITALRDRERRSPSRNQIMMLNPSTATLVGMVNVPISAAAVAGRTIAEYFSVQSLLPAWEEVQVRREVMMKMWLRRIRGAVGMGLVWAAGWAVAGLLIGVTSILLPGLPWDPFFEFFDAPLPALAIPGFFGGALFSTVLGIAGRRRRFDELSLPRFAAWGAVGGLMLSLIPAALVAVGLASVEGGVWTLWQITAVISGPLTLLSAVSASGSLLLARRSENRELLEANGPSDA